MGAPQQPVEHWLNPRRIRAYPRLLLGIFAMMTVVRIASLHHNVDYIGNPIGTDFIGPWSASLAALQGHAAQAYTPAGIFHYERLAVPASDKLFLWFYPPSLYLLILPLARLPYVLSYLVYIAATLALLVVVMRRIVQGAQAMWCLAAFSGLWINIMDGQNAFLTAACAGATILCLERRRPWLGGVFLGLLTVKPHLALLFPVALLAIGAWRTLLSAAITASALLGTGTVVLGRATFNAWLGSIGPAGAMLDGNGLPWQKMPTVYALFRLLGAAPLVAHIAHGIVAVAAIAAVCRVWRRSQDWQLRGAAAMGGTFLISPYVFDYDLGWLAFPIAWLALHGMRRGWLTWEREVLAVAWILPLILAPIASATGVQIGPLVLVALLWIAVRRVATEGAPVATETEPQFRAALA
jgi:hypothetical protein